jgi:hypothetical protein
MRTWSRRKFIQVASIGAGAGSVIPRLSLAAQPCTPNGFSVDGGTVSSPTCGPAPDRPLVMAEHLSYAGTFQPPGDSGGFSYAYGGRAMSWNAAGDSGRGSIFMAGHIGSRSIGEFAVPGLVDARSLGSPSQLPTAPAMQPLTEAAEGSLPTSGIDWPYVYGTHVSNGMLTVGYGWPYQTVAQTVSHYRRPLNFSTKGQVQNSKLVKGPTGNYSNPRYYCGYMCPVPAEWQSQLGGKVLTGNVSQSIISNASDGPAAGAFDPDALATNSTVTLQPLLAYPSAFAPLSGGDPAVVGGGPFPIWNWTATVGGCCIPNGTGSILFFGSNGIGKYGYAKGGSVDTTPGDGETWMYDPPLNTKGEHAYPYRKQIWAYDLRDFAKVRSGTLQPHQLRPYAVWSINTPFQGTSGVAHTPSNPDPAPDTHEIYGTCYDPVRRRIYISTTGGLYGGSLIHAFQVINAVATT